MAWVELTVEDLKPRLSGPELTLLQSRALATGQSDPVPEVIAQAIDEVRGYVSSNRKNVLGPAGTIPAQLKRAAVSIAIWDLAGRPGAGGKIVRTEDRKDAYNDAMKLLERVSKDEFAVEAPESAGPEVAAEPPGGRWGGPVYRDFVDDEVI